MSITIVAGVKNWPRKSNFSPREFFWNQFWHFFMVLSMMINDDQWSIITDCLLHYLAPGSYLAARSGRFLMQKQFFYWYLSSRDLSRSIRLKKWCRTVVEFLKLVHGASKTTHFGIFPGSLSSAQLELARPEMTVALVISIVLQPCPTATCIEKQKRGSQTFNPENT